MVLQLTPALLLSPGYYGNEIDGALQPKPKGEKGKGDEEETELIHNSSEEEMEDDGDLTSVATTPPMKPVITDRSGHTHRVTTKCKQINQKGNVSVQKCFPAVVHNSILGQR